MKVDGFQLGDYMTNCYVVRESDDAKPCWIIDPGDRPQELLTFLEQNALEPQQIVLTHGHVDHIAGIPLLKQTYPDLPVWMAKNDAYMLTDNMLNLSFMSGEPLQLEAADHLFDIGDTLRFGELSFVVLSTPGHTVGGVSLYCQKYSTVFSGDALFAGSVGRSDFPGGSHETLIQGIKEQLLVLDDDTIVYSGHGPATTIGREKQTNQFLI